MMVNCVRERRDERATSETLSQAAKLREGWGQLELEAEPGFFVVRIGVVPTLLKIEVLEDRAQR